MTEAGFNPRAVRSFVRREGRMTKAQRRALTALWPAYGVDADSPLNFSTLFGRPAPVMLEIGFGDGEALCAMAQAHPENNYLGIEVHRPGVGNLLLRLARQGISNVRVICADAKLVLQHRVPEASLDAVFLFFPDPWPKTRHHKRRLVQPDFVRLVRGKLKLGGCFHLATDWEDYAREILHVLSQAEGFENAAGPGNYAPRPQDRLLTKFERRGRKLGHAVYDLIFRAGDFHPKAE